MSRSVGALVADLLLVLLFAVIGMTNHDIPLTVYGVLMVTWPFAVGVLLGHLAVRSWNAPFRVWPHGVMIWAITVAAAMALRTLLSMGTEMGFVVTTAIVLAVMLVGWRAVMSTLHTRRTKGDADSPQRSSTAVENDEEPAAH